MVIDRRGLGFCLILNAWHMYVHMMRIFSPILELVAGTSPRRVEIFDLASLVEMFYYLPLSRGLIRNFGDEYRYPNRNGITPMAQPCEPLNSLPL